MTCNQMQKSESVWCIDNRGQGVCCRSIYICIVRTRSTDLRRVPTRWNRGMAGGK